MISTIVEIAHEKDFDEQGFYSKSYLAVDKRLNRLVAVKDVKYENLKSEAEFEKFFDESYKLSHASHPRVLPVYYVGIALDNEQHKTPRIVTKYFKNGSLNKYLEKLNSDKKTLALDEVIRFSHDIIQGMIHLHSLNIVHLDLKASNIYVGDDNKLVIGDFGQAKFIKEGVIEGDSNIYPAIRPPEANERRVVDKTADIYQFGLLLYSMLCYDKYRTAIDDTYKINTPILIKVFRDKPSNAHELREQFKVNIKSYMQAIKEGQFPDRNNYPYYVPSEIKDVIHKCLAPRVEDRYNNFYQIQEDINAFIFPKYVTELYQDLNTNKLHFVKEEKPCEIAITPKGSKFEINSKKNGRNVTECSESEVTLGKLTKSLFTLIDNL